MKLYICPICGGRDMEGEIYYLATYEDVRYHCRECSHEVIPLATPQELEE